jgi:hypothetical protein
VSRPVVIDVPAARGMATRSADWRCGAVVMTGGPASRVMATGSGGPRLERPEPLFPPAL